MCSIKATPQHTDARTLSQEISKNKKAIYGAHVLTNTVEYNCAIVSI